MLFAVLPVFSQEETTFRVDSRLVEVYATIRGQDGHYLDGLPRERFLVKDNGVPQEVVAFESNSSGFACAILLDTTGSMVGALPTVKSSVLHMLDQMRDDDEVAIYAFSNRVTRLQEFTTDKASAKQAVLRTRANGSTALYDAISQVAREIAPRNGKKAIVVFTDGDDNASVLNARSASQRARKAGVPVYAIAQGEALRIKSLMARLKEISAQTGAQSYQAHRTSQIGEIFESIAADLRHTYLLAYKPPPSNDGHWRRIELTVSGVKGGRIRSKEGYLPE
jgi:VWFA-related protein